MATGRRAEWELVYTANPAAQPQKSGVVSGISLLPRRQRSQPYQTMVDFFAW